MKKVASIGFLFFLITPLCYSQNSFGLKAGANASSIAASKSAYATNRETRIGYHLGFWKEYALSSKFFLRPELFYSLKGYRYTDNSSAPGTVPIKRKVTISYNYITLPLLLGYRPTANLVVYVGPEISTLGPVRGITNGQRGDNLRKIINGYKNLDVGLTAGLLYKLSSKISADLRYTYGFNTVLDYVSTDSQGRYEYSIKESHNKTLQLGLNYTLKKKG